jgi:hypothetical protein
MPARGPAGKICGNSSLDRSDRCTPVAADFRYQPIGALITQYFKTDVTDQHGPPQGEEGILGVPFHPALRDKNEIAMRCYGETGWNTIGLENFDGLYLPLSDDGETRQYDRPRSCV